MNTQTTIEKLKAMRLKGMAELHYASTQNNLYTDYTLDQYTALLADQEWEYRQNRKIENLIKRASFRSTATIKNIDYTSRRGLDKNAFERLATLEFLDKKQNIIIVGPTGTGKSYLAQALGYQACIMLHKTRYHNMSRLSDLIKLVKIDGNYNRLIKGIQQTQLLIIDDFGLHEFDNINRQALMDIVEYKYDQSSIIITSQIPVANWHQLIGEGTIADAILDRLVHSSHRINLSGESMRKAKSVGKQ
jgi:DNA replication protein DnaC